MHESNEQDASFNFQTPSVTAYRMRCPNCSKLYSVESHLILGVETPRFECIACHTSFVARENVSGSTLETFALEMPGATAPTSDPNPAPAARTAIESVPTIATRECPKCHAKNATTSVECTSCGIIMSRYRPGEEKKVIGEIELAGKLEVVSLWEDVTADYQNFSRHEAFVKACMEAGCLPFASAKYARVLAGAPDEEIARAMRKRIVGLATAKFETTTVTNENTRWNVPLPSFNSFIIMLGVILVGVGLGLPQSRDIAGVGFAMLALAAGLRIFTKRPSI